MEECIEVKDLSRSAGLVLASIRRYPRIMAGWKKVRYHGLWFQLFGGIRNGFFIDISNPIGE